MSGIIELIVAIVLTIGFGWLAFRAWRVRSLPVRIIAGVLSSLVTVFLLVVSVVGLAGTYRLYAPHGGPAANITVQATADQINTAAQRAHGCAGCHSGNDTVPLDGGGENLLGGPAGSLFAPNLTPGGPLKDWSDGEIIRAIREGVDRDGHPLITMPSEAFHHLSDNDVQGLVAYIRSQPAVNRATPPRDLSLITMALIGVGAFPTSEQPHIDQPQSAPPAGVTPQYGQYLIDSTGCAVCHGEGLRGRPPGGFGPPPGPNLPAVVGSWQEAGFVSFFRTGVDPYGRQIDPDLMPWRDIGNAYSDDELRAMYAYIKTL